jgi:hypothetical protein
VNRRDEILDWFALCAAVGVVVVLLAVIAAVMTGAGW